MRDEISILLPPETASALDVPWHQEDGDGYLQLACQGKGMRIVVVVSIVEGYYQGCAPISLPVLIFMPQCPACKTSDRGPDWKRISPVNVIISAGEKESPQKIQYGSSWRCHTRSASLAYRCQCCHNVSPQVAHKGVCAIAAHLLKTVSIRP